MQLHTRSPWRTLAVGALTAAVASGLALTGLAPAANAAGSVTIGLANAVEGDSAYLYCLKSAANRVNGSWEQYGTHHYDDGESWIGSSSVAANGSVAFTDAPANAICTVRYYPSAGTWDAGYEVFTPKSTFPEQFIGGYFGWLGSGLRTDAFATFTTSAAGDFSGSYALVQPTTITGYVGATAGLTAKQIETATVRLYDSHIDLVTGLSVLDQVASVELSPTGAFKFEKVQAGRTYAIQALVEGLPHTWLGGSNDVTGYSDPYDETIAKVASAATPGANVHVGSIVLAKVGTTVLGSLKGIELKLDSDDGSYYGGSVTAYNLVTGRSVSATVAPGAYEFPGLAGGIWMIEASGNDGDGNYRQAIQLVTVPPSGSLTVNLTAYTYLYEDLGLTRTGVNGEAQIGAKLTASSSTVSQNGGLAMRYAYTWFTEDSVIGTGAKLVVPNTLDKQIYVLTLVDASNIDIYPSWTVATAYGKITLRSAPTFDAVTIKGDVKVGKKVKAVLPKNAKGFKAKYQWYRGAKAIKGKAAQKSKYKVTKKDKGKKLSVRVTLTKATYTDGLAKSVKIKVKAK